MRWIQEQASRYGTIPVTNINWNLRALNGSLLGSVTKIHGDNDWTAYDSDGVVFKFSDKVLKISFESAKDLVVKNIGKMED